MDFKDEFVSIITIVLNGEKYIEQTMLSVFAEKRINIEYIIIDGGSSDSTMKIIEKYKNNIDVVISESDNGIYHAINKGIKLAKGDLIGIIHCGDYYLPGGIFNSFDTYIKTKADIIYGDLIIIEEMNSSEFTSTVKPNHLNLGQRMSIFHPSTFITKKCYELNGLYDTSLKVAADYSLFLKNFLDGVHFEYVNFVVAAFRAGGISSTNSKIHTKELFSIQSHYLGFNKAVYNISIRLLTSSFFNLRRQLIIFLIGRKNFEKFKFLQKKYFTS